MTETIENTNKLLVFISNKFENDELDNNSLVQIIELCGSYLNLQKPSDYMKENNLSYNGTIKETRERKIIKLFNYRFIVNNF